MLPSQRVLSDLIGGIYDAASDPALWEAFLARLAETADADAAALVMHHLGRESHTISASWRMDPEASCLYQQHYGSVDVWAMKGRSKSAGYVCTSESLCRPQELATTEIYNDFLIRFGIVHGMFGLVENNASRWASLSLYRDSSSGEFRVSDLETINLLIPHVQRAFKLHFQFAEIKGRTDGIETALNKLTVGVIFLDSDGAVVLMNRQAEDVLQAKNGLLLNRGRLRARVDSESGHLRALIQGVLQTSSGRGRGAGGTILVSRLRGRPLSITVAPLRNEQMGLGKSPCAVLFVSDPDQRWQPPLDVLQQCHRLTSAEARLTMIMLEGGSLKDAADRCGVSHNTAKSQLKSVFEKIGVQRQGELIKLLLTSAGQVRA